MYFFCILRLYFDIIDFLFNPGLFSGSAVVKNLPVNAGGARLIPGSGRSPGEGNGKPLQCSCLENSMDRVAWWATVHSVTKSWTWLSNWPHKHALFVFYLMHLKTLFGERVDGNHQTIKGFHATKMVRNLCPRKFLQCQIFLLLKWNLATMKLELFPCRNYFLVMS